MASNRSPIFRLWCTRSLPTRIVSGVVAAAGILAAAGCSYIIQRGQSPDTEAMEFGEDFQEPVYVGDVARPTGMTDLKVDGIGLVTQLEGTGSEPRPSGQRDYLVAEIKTHNIEDINGLLASNDNSMALVMGMIPPGARKGDRFDVHVQSLKRSKTTSLEGGFLMQARMKPFVQTRQNMSFGHNTAVVRGRVIVDSIFESADDSTNLVSGLVPGGGVVIRDRTNELRIVRAHRSVKTATGIAAAVNERFSTHVQGTPEGVANPLNDQVIEMLIPENYRHNVGRYFHVVLNIAFQETPAQRVNRLEVMERNLHDPEKSSIAAIRLEAIGEEAKNVLKRGLRSDDAKVRFHSAEALAYMSDNSGLEILRDAAGNEPAFRWHALTAMACLRDAVTEEALASLFDSASAEARYGAFQTLRQSIPDSLMIGGESFGQEFMLHTVASKADPMIHISRTSVPEIVLFGGDQHFTERLLFVASGLTVKAAGNGQVMVKRYLPNGEEKQVTCSTLISDVIRQMVRLDADYGDVIQMLKDARRNDAMDSRLVINAVPRLSKSYRSAEGQRSGTADNESATADPGDPPPVTVSQRPPPDQTESQGKGILGRFW
jgi:hypothetical protein